MKIALCLYGQPRFLNNPHVKKRLEEKLFSQYDIDVFGHFWYSEEINDFTGSDWHAENKFYKATNTVEVIKERYHLKKYTHEPPKDFSNILTEEELLILKNKRPNFAGENYYSITNVRSLLSHIYSIEAALNLIPDNTYDFIILTRYDSLIRILPAINSLPPGFIYSSNHSFTNSINTFADNIIIIDGKLTKALKAYSNIKNIIPKIELWTAECIKFENIKYYFNEDIIKYIEMQVSVVRRDDDNTGQM